MSEPPPESISKAHLEAIGCVATNWSVLELVIEFCIFEIAEILPQLGRSLTTHMGITQRLDALLSLVNEQIPDTALQADIKKLNKIIRRETEGKPSLQSERNRVIHSIWADIPQPDKAAAVRWRAYGKVTVYVSSITPEEILDIARQIVAVSTEIEEWQIRLREHLKKVRPPSS